jgi:3-oxoacyl-[acyl-carrier protein] reductase
MIETKLSGRVAVVTGANHGIGAAAAQGLAAQGTKVLITYLRYAHGVTESTEVPGREFHAKQRARSGQEVVSAINAFGGVAIGLEADLSMDGSADRVLDFAEGQLGPVEILVNNAAYSAGDTFDPQRGTQFNPAGLISEAFTAERFDRHIAVNTRAVALLMASFARRHVARGATWGRIINLSTDAAHTFPTQVSYGASKFATESLTRSAAVELGQHGITVNVVSPGPTQTGYITPDNEPQVQAMIPLGRLGTPEDVADVIVFLASEQGRWLTGQVLYAAGGKTM